MNSPIANSVERLVDRPQEISLREFLTKIYIRPFLFWSCIIVPTVLALLGTALVPTDWKASVKILLRYSSTESPFLQGLIPDNRASISGAASAEILRSIPTLVNTIREQGISEDDIYRKPHEVLGGHLSNLLEGFSDPSLPPGLPGIDPRTLLLAKTFKDSLEESSSSSKRKPVEVLEKTSQMPVSLKGDELITVEVRSFNREKVAAMTNGLAKAFIDEYYRVSAEEARRSYDFLGELVARAEQDVINAEKGLPTQETGRLLDSLGGGAPASPLLDSLSRELTGLQTRLSEAESIFAGGADEVERLRSQVTKAHAALLRQERIEAARQVLEQLKVRRFQARNAEKLYAERLVPISVVEPAFTPKKSFSKVAVRYAIAGGVGLVLGLMLALGLVVVLDATDPRLHTSWQVPRWLGLPILATLPDLGRKAREDVLACAQDSSLGMVNGLLQILTRISVQPVEGARGRVLVIGSSSRGEGKTFVTLALGSALGCGGRHRVLLIDANLQDAELSRLLGHEGARGYVDSILGGESFLPAIRRNSYRNCDVLPAGGLTGVDRLGFYGDTLAERIAELRSHYDFVIIDTSPLLASNEAMLCGLCADSSVLVVSAGVSRRALVRASMQKLQDVSVRVDGVIFNRKRDLLPGFIYRNV